MPDRIIITIDGTEQKDLLIDLREAVVDTNLYLPAMFSLTIKDNLDRKTSKLQYADSDTYKVGAEVKIELETDDIPDEPNPVKATLIIGEITAVEPVFANDGVALLRVRGYDRSHRLTRGKKTRVYGDGDPTGSGINEEQIINTIVQETDGITAQEIDTSGFSSINYPYVMQYNQTDLEFLWSRARQLGYQVYVDDAKLLFQKADAHRGLESDKPAALRWGWSLTSFEPRLSLVGQVTEALVKGWDPATKAAIEGTSNTDSSGTIPAVGLNKKGSALTKEAFKDPAEQVVIDHPVLTIDQAKAMAAARFAEAESEFIRAEGHCRLGDPRLIAGRMVTIEGVGERFSGDYYVTEAQHTFVRGRYQVTFSVTGRTPNTLMHLLNEDESNGNGHGLIQGVVTAKVASLEDPEELGRVQLMYPWLPKYKDADLASNWARLASPMAGVERGLFFMPEIDDEVLVAFEHGDINYPYIVGALWHNTDKPPKGTKDSVLASDKKTVDQRVLRSRSGHLIILDDTEGEEQIIIQDMTEKNQIIINSKENTMTVNVEKDLTIVAKGAATIESTDNMTIKSTGDLSIECKNFNVKAQANAKLEATANIDLKATGQLNLKGAQATLEGDAMSSVKSNSMVQVQSSALVKVQGNPIMLN
jgi:uncharacterized protein involved in type VI secretion and phage assembly